MGIEIERKFLVAEGWRAPFCGHTWEIDEFTRESAGLVVGEVELASEDERFQRPPWLGREVTDDARYYNLNLACHPYREWSRP